MSIKFKKAFVKYQKRMGRGESDIVRQLIAELIDYKEYLQEIRQESIQDARQEMIERKIEDAENFDKR